MSGTCATCWYWDRSRLEDDEPYGRCASAESDDGNPVRGKVPTHPAYAMDASGYHASLRTLPTFGCNQHESSQEEKRANTAKLVPPTIESLSRR